jgi:hypothetical protein
VAVSNVELRVDARNAVRELKKTNDASKQLNNTLDTTKKQAATASGNIQRMGIAFRSTIAPIVAAYGAINILNRSLQIAGEREAQVATLAAGLKRLGQSQSEIDQLTAAADRLGRQTLFDEEDFTAGFTLLTSFRRIGVDSYERVTTAAADLAQTTGQDVRSALMQLSKALEDPSKRVTDLARSGTVFTDQQKEQIKTLQESGRLLEAQNLILSEIEMQYGGAADAAGSAGYAGAQDTLNESLRDLQEALGNLTLPAAIQSFQTLTQVVDALTGKVEALREEFRFWNTVINQVATGLPQVEFSLQGVTDRIAEATKTIVPFARFLELSYKFLRLMGEAQLPSDFGDAMDGGGFLPAGQPLDPRTLTTPTTPKPTKTRDANRDKAQAERQRLSFLKQINAEINRINQAELDGIEAGRQIVERIDRQGAADIARGEANLALLQAKLDGRYEEEVLAQRIKAIEESNLNDVQKNKQIAIVNQTAALESQIQVAEKLNEVYESVGSAIQSGIVDAITSAIDGSKSLGESLSGILKQVGGILLNFGIGGIGSSLGIPGFRANGGPVTSGRPYIVGEQGPELFMPRSGGAVTSNSELRQAMSQPASSMNFTFETTSIGGTEYVSREQLEAAMATTRRQAASDGAKRGMNMTLDRMQNSPRTRARVGIS